MARKKHSSFARCVFLPCSHRENLPTNAVILDVSSYAEPPWHTFSPIWTHGGIPIPGQPGKLSDTVEGIWQGLKVIRGKTAPHLFRGRGQKRGGKPAGHLFGDRLLDLVEARRKIYQPAYEWVLANRIDPELIALLIDRAFAGITQYFHDLGDNSDINRDEPWAHACIVVQYLNRLCEQRPGISPEGASQTSPGQRPGLVCDAPSGLTIQRAFGYPFWNRLFLTSPLGGEGVGGEGNALGKPPLTLPLSQPIPISASASARSAGAVRPRR